jgi:two-component system CheB/CheR fusion protein
LLILRKSGPKKSRRRKFNEPGAEMKSHKLKSGAVAGKNPSSGSVADNASFPVVAIGASAGGLEAYKEFFHALPAGTGMAFVLVQHLDPTHHSLLTEIIAKATKMPVEEVRSGVKIRPDCVYVIPPNAFMSLSEGALILTPRSKGPAPHLAVNFFMRSLAESRGTGAIGIIFSGTGADGTLGLENIKAEGGITFAQEPTTAKYDGMPRSAIDSGCVDFVLPPKDIAKEVERIRRHPYLLAQEEARAERGKDLGDSVAPRPGPEKDFNAIVEQLRKTSGVDFSQYKPNTIHRRTLRRMVILKQDSLGEYATYLKKNPEEASKLFDDVLIPVTSFFRDFEAFEALKTQVYPVIVKNKGSKGTIRMWAPGCSTGEETYSLAMTLLEFLGDKAPSFQVQIFGTDLNDKGIQKARAGVYRQTIAEEISPERMQRFFTKVDEGYRVSKTVRDMCVFARQNLAYDPPFSQMDVVACRNLLIYIQPVLQKKIIPILHYALKPSGFLVLGSSESVAAFPDLFSTVNKKHKIYGKKSGTSRLSYDFAQPYLPAASGIRSSVNSPKAQELPEGEMDVQAEADRLVLKNHSPAGVVIDSNMEVAHFRGRTAPYLEAAPGKASLNVLKLARNGLAIELRTLISAAMKKYAPVKREGISFNGNGHSRILNLSVSPLGDKASKGKRFFLILFDDVTPPGTSTAKATSRHKKEDAESKPESKRLRQELARAQEALHSAIESEDALKEEFQSANEEILSANEELQSTNEELETSKEELQSTNEELNTLNDELRNRNNELGQLNNDLANLLDAIRIPILFVGADLRIRRLTSAAAEIFRVLPSDIGRPVTDIRHNLNVPDLAKLIQGTVANLTTTQREVQDAEGRWRSLEIRPYRTADNRIEGAVLALPDIDSQKHSEQYLKQIIENVPNPLLVLDGELKILLANLTFCRTFHVSQAETEGQILYHLGNEQWNIPKLRELLEEILPQSKQVENFMVTHDFPEIGVKTMLVSGRRIEDVSGGGPAMVLLSIEDITARKFTEAAMMKSEKLAAAGRLAATLAHEINNPLQAVSNLLTLLTQSSSLGTQDLEYATMAATELGQVTHLTRQSLSFYRESSFPISVNMQELLEGVLDLYKHKLAAKKITVTKRFRLDGTIQSYPGEIRQVFSTLLVNAMEAVPEGGKIVLHAACAFDSRQASAHSGVQVNIADNGSGIPARNLELIFEPFFTTKGERGTGLGLWVARAIVQRLGGSIHVRSDTRPGKSSTCFTTFLPNQLPRVRKSAETDLPNG